MGSARRIEIYVVNFNRSIFLTGFPGFIAGRLVERLADKNTQFFLLIQPKFLKAAEKSVTRIAFESGVPLENFVLVKGDITLTGMGIPSNDLETIKKWLRVFLQRFFKTSQFKRSALPNGPKVGSGGSLSPRGDWRAPSDSEAEVWLRELEANVP